MPPSTAPNIDAKVQYCPHSKVFTLWNGPQVLCVELRELLRAMDINGKYRTSGGVRNLAMSRPPTKDGPSTLSKDVQTVEGLFYGDNNDGT